MNVSDFSKTCTNVYLTEVASAGEFSMLDLVTSNYKKNQVRIQNRLYGRKKKSSRPHH